jgi:hypothetical protein
LKDFLQPRLSASEIREASLADGAATDFTELNPGYGKTIIAHNELLRIVPDLPFITTNQAAIAAHVGTCDRCRVSFNSRL